MRNIPLYLFLCLLLPAGLSAQSVDREVVAQAGGVAVAPALTLEWTLGELATATNAATAGLWLTEGFHQPLLELTSPPHADQPFDVAVFPNPFLADLTLTRAPEEDRPLHYRLDDVTGRRVVGATRVTDGPQVRLGLPPLASGIYFLSLLDDEGTTVGQFRLVRQ